MSGRVRSEKQSPQDKGLLEDVPFCGGGSCLHSPVRLSASRLERGPEDCRAGRWQGKVDRKSQDKLECIPMSRDWDLHQSLSFQGSNSKGLPQRPEPTITEVTVHVAQESGNLEGTEEAAGLTESGDKC